MASDAATAHPLIRGGLDGLRLSRGFLLGLLKSLEDKHLLMRPCPGGNHPMWIAGHLAACDDVMLRELAGQPSALPPTWDGLFWMNSEPSDDRGVYPGREEVMEALSERRKALRAWLASLGEAELLAPIEGPMAGLAKDRAMLASSLAFHEGMHAGQLSAARRAAGLPRVY